MSDQADTLRRLMQQRQSDAEQIASRTLESQARRPARSSRSRAEKAAWGRAVSSPTLGTMLARQGFRVLLVDGDFGLANLDILLNVQPVATLEQVLDGQATLQEAVVGVEPNLWLIPAASGLIDYQARPIERRASVSCGLRAVPLGDGFHFHRRRARAFRTTCFRFISPSSKASSC